MNYGGKAVRGGQLFGEETKIAMTKKYFKGLQGVENIYTQHKPYLIDILQVMSSCLSYWLTIRIVSVDFQCSKILRLQRSWNGYTVCFSSCDALCKRYRILRANLS